jgi:Helix-turn-helix domain of resolvase
MEATTQPRGRGRPKGTESTHVMIRMPNDLLAQIDAYAESLEAQIGISDVNVSRAMAIRELCKKGLQSLATGAQPQPATLPAPASATNGTRAPAPTTQPAIPLALEPAPTTAPPVDVPQAAETPEPRKTPTVPTGMQPCPRGHAPYPMSQHECPACRRERQRRQRQDERAPAPEAPAALRPRRELNKLTPSQEKALRAKRQQGTPIKALMEEYGVSKATVFRYLAEAKDTAGPS